MADLDPNQRALGAAGERLGQLLEKAANAHEMEDAVRRETWRRIAEAATQVAAYASLLAGGDDQRD